MITITPAATVALRDTGITPNPNPVPFGGLAVSCPTGANVQDVILAAISVNVALPFPIGLTTAAIIGIFASEAADLIVTVSGVDFSVPLEQPFFLYDVAAADISFSSVLGGKITYLVGG